MLDNNAELGWASPSSCPYEKVNITPRFQKGLPKAPKSHSPVPALPLFGAPKLKEVECTACSFNYWPLAQQDK